jgi:hypothetical protein
MRSLNALLRETKQVQAKVGTVSTEPDADDCLNALRAFEAGAVAVRLGAQVLTRDDYERMRTENDARSRAYHLELTHRHLAKTEARAKEFEQAGPSFAGIATLLRGDETDLRKRLDGLEDGSYQPWRESRERRLARRRTPGA